MTVRLDIRGPGSYFGREHFAGVEDRGGRVMHFAGWSHPPQDYAGAIHEAGLVILQLREPKPSRNDEHLPTGTQGPLRSGTRLPLFLWISAARPR